MYIHVLFSQILNGRGKSIGKGFWRQYQTCYIEDIDGVYKLCRVDEKT